MPGQELRRDDLHTHIKPFFPDLYNSILNLVRPLTPTKSPDLGPATKSPNSES